MVSHLRVSVQLCHVGCYMGQKTSLITLQGEKNYILTIGERETYVVVFWSA